MSFIRLRSAEKHTFIVERSVAQTSGLLRTMLASESMESQSKEIDLPDITTAVLERVIAYFYYKAKYQGSAKGVPEFQVPPELALQMLIAADYLEV